MQWVLAATLDATYGQLRFDQITGWSRSALPLRASKNFLLLRNL